MAASSRLHSQAQGHHDTDQFWAFTDSERVLSGQRQAGLRSAAAFRPEHRVCRHEAHVVMLGALNSPILDLILSASGDGRRVRITF